MLAHGYFILVRSKSDVEKMLPISGAGVKGPHGRGGGHGRTRGWDGGGPPCSNRGRPASLPRVLRAEHKQSHPIAESPALSWASLREGQKQCFSGRKKMKAS